MSDNEIKIFPSDRTEALAMLYLQSQDLSGKSPKEIVEMYNFAYSEIKSNSGDAKKQQITY